MPPHCSVPIYRAPDFRSLCIKLLRSLLLATVLWCLSINVLVAQPSGSSAQTSPQSSAAKAGAQVVDKTSDKANDKAGDKAETAAGKDSGKNVAKKAASDQSVLPAKGLVSWISNSEKMLPATKDRDASVMLLGKVRLNYQDLAGRLLLALKADNVVILLSKKADLTGRLKPEDVQGIYLEGHVVVTNGQYTMRAPRIYYDLALNKALLLDAVFFTWDPKRGIPMYVRAKRVQQESKNSWSADDAIITTSEFAVPHVAMAASNISFTRTTQDDGSVTQHFDIKDSRILLGKLPVFYWPRLAGDAANYPLRRASIGQSNDDGVSFKSSWHAFGLLGLKKPDGVDLTVDFDFLGDHGPGTGLQLEYDKEGMFGKLDAYLLPQDEGTDQIGGRTDISHEDDVRGWLKWQHKSILPDNWELSLEAGYVSDETFLEEFLRGEAEDEKQMETSIYLKKQNGDRMFSILASYDVLDFTTQTTTLQAPGYTVDRLPEAGFFIVGKPLWGGRLVYFSENRVSNLRMRPGSDTPADRGFRPADSLALFGIANTTSFRDAFVASGLPTDHVFRFDTRHELMMPFNIGMIRLTPYVVGRSTSYGDDFVEFGGEDDSTRWWGAVGIHARTQVSRTFDDIDSRVLDLHRLRHIIEPSIDLSVAGSTLHSNNLPVFDSGIEGITEGTTLRIGLRNTLQTKRGGPGRWRNVDWLVLDTDLVLRSDDTDTATELAHYFDYRPELTVGGDHFYSRLAWQVSDSFAMAGDMTYNLERDGMSQWRLGASMQHSSRFSSFIDYMDVDILDTELLSYGINYQLSDRYTVGVSQTLSFGTDQQSRRINFNIERRLPRWRLRVFVTVDELDGDQTIGIELVPEGMGGNQRTLSDEFNR
jgi:hypothetical protein